MVQEPLVNNKKTALLVDRAFSLRNQNLGWKVTFVKPHATLSVSMTGTECCQRCAHCDGRYLNSMTHIENVVSDPEQYLEQYSSLLISGGFIEDMRLPIAENEENIRKLKQAGFRLNFHVQKVRGRDIEVISTYADSVSIDYMASPKIIQDVYKTTSYEPPQIIDTILNLRDSVKVVPHITLGLEKGRIESEYTAIEDLKQADIDYLVVNVLRPGKNTEFQDVQVPDNKEILRFLCACRSRFPYLSLAIGCMRPGGSLRRKIDNLALIAGFDTIVNPLPETMEYAIRMGLDPSFSEECCALGALIY
jgi:uncharacterized radical SAM superfamily protein